MRRFTAITALLTLCLFVSAQENHPVSWGPVLKRSSLSIGGKFKSRNNSYDFVTDMPKGVELLRLNASLDIGAEKTQEVLAADGKKLTLFDIVMGGEKLYVLGYKVEKENLVFSHAECKEDGTVGEVQSTGVSILNKSKSDPQVYGSNDHSKIAIVISETPDEEVRKYTAYLFDGDFKLIRKATINIPNKGDGAGENDVMLSNGGDIYFLHDEWPDEKSKDKALDNYKTKFFVNSASGFKEWEIKLQNNVLSTKVDYIVRDNGEFIMTGFYTISDGQKTKNKGVFVYKLDPATGEVLVNKAHPFDERFPKDIGSGVNAHNLVVVYRVLHGHEYDDGSISFFAEDRYKGSTSLTMGSAPGPSYNDPKNTYVMYNDGTVIMPRFSANGDLLWVATIEKSFNFEEHEMSERSFFPAFTENGTYLVYNTHKTRDQRDEGRKTIYSELAFVDNQGKVSVKPLFNTQEADKLHLQVQRTREVNSNKLLMLRSANVFQFGTIEVK